MSKTPKTRSGKSAVVLEIGNDWIKIVQTEASKGGVSVSKIHLEKFDATGSGVSKSISNAFNKLKFSKMPVITCLPRQAATIRMVELPSTDPDEIADMVDLQIGKLTPYSKDEIASDYRIVGAGREGYTRVMLVIVQRSVLRQKFYMIDEAGLDVERMSVSTEGILNWTQGVMGDGQGGALLDVDSFYSDLSIVSEDGMVFTRSILVGANHLIEDYEKSREKLAREILSAMETSRGETPGLRIDRLMVSGAGPGIEGLTEFLGGHLDLASEAVDSTRVARKMPKTPALDSPDYQTVSLTALLGVGMAPENLEFDLVPDSVKMRKGLETKARSLTALGILVMTALFSASMFMTLRFFLKRSELKNLKIEEEKMSPSVVELTRKSELINVARERMNLKHSAANIFATIHPLVPDGVLFETISMTVASLDDGAKVHKLEIVGSSKSTPLVLKTIKNMEDSELFENVKDDGIDRDNRTGKYNFKIRCRLENGK